MGKTPSQENRAAAKKAGMSHDKVKAEAAAEAARLKKYANADLDFGNKNKGAGMNKKADLAKQRAKDLLDPTTEIGRAHLKEQKKKAQEELDFLLHKKGIKVKQPELPEGTDPKTVLCEFFKWNCCTKGDKCKFSHDKAIEKKLAERAAKEKASIYETKEEEGMEGWTQEQLEEAINKKHGSESNQNNPTTIVCKHFIEAVEKRLYGWFWSCPSGPECKYKHKLPEGYLLKSEMRDLLLEQRQNRRTDDDMLKEKLQALELKAQTPGAGKRVELTQEDYETWRKAHDERIFEKKRKAVEERHKKNSFTGRELIEKGMVNMDDADDDCAFDMAEYMDELKKRQESQLKRAEEEAQFNMSSAQAAKEGGETYGEAAYEEETPADVPMVEAEAEASDSAAAAPATAAAAVEEPARPKKEKKEKVLTEAQKKILELKQAAKAAKQAEKDRLAAMVENASKGRAHDATLLVQEAGADKGADGLWSSKGAG